MIRYSDFVLGLLVIFSVLATDRAAGEPISFRFEGTVQSGSLGSTSLDGMSLVAEGVVTNETPDFAGGTYASFFAEETTFTFGGGVATFVADAGTTLFSQQNANVGSGDFIQNALHANSSFANVIYGNTATTLGIQYVDPFVPEAVGLVPFVESARANGTGPFTLVNAASQTLMISEASWLTLLTTSYAPVPEPTSIVMSLCALGMFVSCRKHQ